MTGSDLEKGPQRPAWVNPEQRTNPMTRAAAVTALFALIAIHPAHAAQPNPQGIPVAYGDLDLGTTAGRSELKVRLEAAAAKLCSPVLPGPDYRGSEQSIHELGIVYRACIGRLSERAMAQVDIRRN